MCSSCKSSTTSRNLNWHWHGMCMKCVWNVSWICMGSTWNVDDAPACCQNGLTARCLHDFNPVHCWLQKVNLLRVSHVIGRYEGVARFCTSSWRCSMVYVKSHINVDNPVFEGSKVHVFRSQQADRCSVGQHVDNKTSSYALFVQ